MIMPEKNRKKCTRIGTGFTLVELLVVISIIALLLSILMPSLQKVRESAKAVVCLSQMKQLSTAVYLYSASNNGWALPSSATSGGQMPQAGPLWFMRLKQQKYIDYKPFDLANPDNCDAGILHCPSDRRHKGAYSYSANRYVMGFSNPTPGNVYEESMRVKRLSNVRRPSDVIMLGERGSMNIGDLAKVENYWSPAGSSVWTYIGSDNSGQYFGFYAARHSKAKVSSNAGGKGSLSKASITLAKADGSADILRISAVDCMYNRWASLPVTGEEIDKAIVTESMVPAGWPKLDPQNR